MRKIKISVILLLINIFLKINTDATQIDTEHLEYSEAYKKMYAKDGVKISSGDFSIMGQEMVYSIGDDYVVVKGSVAITTGGSYFLGDEIRYNMNEKTGEIFGGSGKIGSYFFNAKEIKMEKEFYVLKNCKVSTCEVIPPHYFLRVSESKLIPEDVLKMKHATFWLGPLPFFYFPYIPWSLKKRSDCWWITPGYSGGGSMLRIIYGFPVTDSSYNKIYFDNFSVQGLGIGTEYNYRKEGNYKGTFYGYHIKEKNTGKDRWSLRSVHWQKLSKEWSLQTNLEFLSDESFNSYYFTESWTWMQKNPFSSIGITRATGKSNLRVYAERYDIYDSTRQAYSVNSFFFPALDYTLYPLMPKWIPVFLGFNTSLKRSYRKFEGTTYIDFSKIESLSNIYLYRDIPLTQNDIFTPKIGLIESWADAVNKEDDSDISLTKLYTDMRFRHRLNTWTNFDLNYNWIKRFKKNSFETDTSDMFYGIENNSLNYTLFITPSHQTTFRVNSGYDFRKSSSSLIDNISRYRPISFDYNTKKDVLSLNIRYVQKIKPFSMESIQCQFNYNLESKKYFNLLISQNASLKNAINISNSFAFWLSRKTNVNISQTYNYEKSTFDSSKNILRIQEQRVEIYRNLHCWEARFYYKKRRAGIDVYGRDIYNDEFMLNFGLSIGSTARGNLYNIEHEQEVFYWRQKD